MFNIRNNAARFPTPNQIAVVAVDAQLKHRKNANIGRLLSAAKDAGAHRILFRYMVTGRETEPIAADIIEAAGKGARIFHKYEENPFPRLHKLLMKREVTTVILCGYHKYACVRKAGESALDYGYSVITAPDLLIGHDHTLKELKAERLYRSEVRMYGSTRDIVLALGDGSLDGRKARSRTDRLERRIWDAIIGASENPKRAFELLKSAQAPLAKLEAESFEKAFELARFLKRVLSMTPPNPRTARMRAEAEKPLNRIIYGHPCFGEIRTDEDLGWVH